MRSFSLAIAMAVISAAAAAPTANTIVPELSLVQSEWLQNAKAAADAKKAVQQMLETGSDSSACKDLADTILTEVEDSIKSMEETLSYMPDGSACKSEGQSMVDAAQATLDSAQTTKSSADAAAATAASAPVDFGTYSLSSISTATSCTQFQNDPVYTAAVTTSQQAQDAATTAAAELTAAQNALTFAQDAQAKAIKTCECAAFTAYDAAYKVANTRSDADLSAWKKGKHMQCVLAGTDASACDVGSPPEVQRCALADGVVASSCGAPTPKKYDYSGATCSAYAPTHLDPNHNSAYICDTSGAVLHWDNWYQQNGVQGYFEVDAAEPMGFVRFSLTCTRSAAFRISFSDDKQNWENAWTQPEHSANPSVEWDFMGKHKYWRYELIGDWQGGPWYQNLAWEYLDGDIVHGDATSNAWQQRNDAAAVAQVVAVEEVLLQQGVSSTCKIGQSPPTSAPTSAPTNPDCVKSCCKIKIYSTKDYSKWVKTIEKCSYTGENPYVGYKGDIKSFKLSKDCDKVKLYDDDDGQLKGNDHEDFTSSQASLKKDLRNDIKGVKLYIPNKNTGACNVPGA